MVQQPPPRQPGALPAILHHAGGNLLEKSRPTIIYVTKRLIFVHYLVTIYFISLVFINFNYVIELIQVVE